MDNGCAYSAGIYLLFMADDGLDTKQLKKAIKELELIIYSRENLPF